MTEDAVIAAARAPEPRLGTVRPYEKRDRDAVREICRRTAYRNRGAETVFEDRELFADYWCSYYTDFEPESCLVVEEEGEVIGYLFGCTDAKRFIHMMSRRIVPLLLMRMIGRYVTFRYRQKTTRRMIRWFLLHSWRENPGVPVERFPSHFHCNILPRGYGKNYYTTMALLFVARLKRMGVTALHGQVTEPRSGGVWRMMGKAYGQPQLIEYYAEKPSSFNRIVLGENMAMVNRAWGAQLDPYQAWLKWAAGKYRI